MAEDQLEDWIIQGDLKKERRSRIVPSSTDRLASEDPGDSEAAMTAVAAWLDTMPDLPVVEFAVLSPHTISITFAEDAVLPEPWGSPLGDPQQSHNQWGITHHDAVSLPRGESYGWQTAGLTALGTLSDGNRLLVSTCRWETLQIAGTDEWVRNLIITCVMNQAAEPWSAEHDIWLIGFGDTAKKLTNFLADEHPPHRFHIAESLSEISAQDLKDTTATLYVLGAAEQTEPQFQALQVSGAGMITDLIVTDKAMFLSERDGGVAVLGPFRRNLEIWPNLREDLVEKMEQAWELNEEAARQKAAAADFVELLDERSAAEEKTPEQIKADFEALMAQSNVTAEDFTIGAPGTGKTFSDDRSDAQEESEDSMTEQSESPSDTDHLITEQADEVSTGEEHDEDEEPAEPEEPRAGDQQEPDDRDVPPVEDQRDEGPGPEAPNDPNASNRSNSDGVTLTLLGAARADTPEGELTGRHAAALIILELISDPLPAQQISETLWPGDETEGHTARTRRSRMLSKLRSHIGDIITITDEGWTIEPGHISTDYDQVLDVLSNEPIDRTETIIEACQRIARPLDGAEDWADYYRAQVTATLTEALTELKTRAIEAEAFDVAKAAKAASTTLGEE